MGTRLAGYGLGLEREGGDGVRHEPRFYYTTHPSDLTRLRLLEGCHIMIVATAFWDDKRRRFKIHRPPADHVATISIDGGGFTAAKRWGRYPWTPAQYADWIQEESDSVTLDFCAILDYACERGVDRSTYRTNRDRIKATIRNEIACREAAPDLPWLPVLQGNTLEERDLDLRMRRRIGMLPADYAGIGSVCGRTPSEAGSVVKFYADRLPGLRFHGFGLHIQALDDDAVFGALRSWDSYSWNWGRGLKDIDRPAEYFHREGETWSQYSHRLAWLYWQNTIRPRLRRVRNLVLW